MLRAYVGWDGRDALAFEVCRKSLVRHASKPVQVVPLKDWELRRRGLYWRGYRVDAGGQKWDDRDGTPFSTDFSFTRFLVPLIEGFGEVWVLFCDADMLWRADVGELMALADPDCAVMCVQHDHRPHEAEKMGGLKQTVYARKNWSSLMLIKPARCRALTKYAVNNQGGQWLHAMCWAAEEEIGALPEEWNWLEGWSRPELEPKLVHFTRGTPDMPGHEDAAYAGEWWAEIAEVKNQGLAVGKLPLAFGSRNANG